MANSSLFRKSSLQAINSPKQLNNYIKVSSLGMWLILIAILILILMFVFWTFTGSVPTSLKTMGVASSSNTATIYIDIQDADTLKLGMEVMSGSPPNLTVIGSIGSISDKPVSKQKASEQIDDDYAAYALDLPEWSVAVTVRCNTELDIKKIYELYIITESVKPIEFLTAK